ISICFKILLLRLRTNFPVQIEIPFKTNFFTQWKVLKIDWLNIKCAKKVEIVKFLAIFRVKKGVRG
ncbi:MAG: hypothetical protein ABWJ99_07890, partial [Caldimicrobium sp.]